MYPFTLCQLHDSNGFIEQILQQRYQACLITLPLKTACYLLVVSFTTATTITTATTATIVVFVMTALEKRVLTYEFMTMYRDVAQRVTHLYKCKRYTKDKIGVNSTYPILELQQSIPFSLGLYRGHREKDTKSDSEGYLRIYL
uniref:Uncharacterized protein n=1 Tax=Lygus hesperus TaxID=30085 RepID=A0A146LI75_LYGHE